MSRFFPNYIKKNHAVKTLYLFKRGQMSLEETEDQPWDFKIKYHLFRVLHTVWHPMSKKYHSTFLKNIIIL